MADRDNRIVTDSGIEIDPIYSAPAEPVELEAPGEYPYTRGIYPTMYRGRKWTMRQYAGFTTAEESNRRYRLLLERGQTGLSVAFDLPTQLGIDSDDPRAFGEVGRVGVPISTLDNMRTLFDGIDQGSVTTSMTINAPASILLLMYQTVAEERGVDPASLGGTIQNDILKEYAARGTYIFPPRPSMRLVVDTFAYCKDVLPNWNTISISGYHIREAGSSAAQEIGFTLANAIAYVEAATAAGLAVDDFAPRLSFFFAAHSNLFEEAAKFRRIRSRGSSACTRKRAASPSPRSNRSTTWCASPTRRSPPCSAARRACTPTASMKPWRCQPRKPQPLRCARSKSWPRKPASPPPPTRLPVPTSLRRSPTSSKRKRRSGSTASTSRAAL
jgi:methylmalonyl-CoA mutase N-terminal domain/subunit